MASAASSPPSYFPRVSVVVPIYNGEQDLPGLLRCLRAQTYPADKVEYLLVDNGSRDRTPQLLSIAAGEFATAGLTFEFLSETDIQSSYAARNKGICAATGDFIAFTDADCYPKPHWLSELIQPFQSDTVGIVAGEIAALPGNTLLERYAEKEEMLSQQHTLNHVFGPYGQTANVAIRMAAFEQVGLFRPYLTTGGDADICWRIQREGHGPHGLWQIEYAPQATVQHRHRKTIKGLYAQWYRYGKSNRYLHDLHGIALSNPLPKKEENRTLLKWLLRDLPQAVIILLFQRRVAVEKLVAPVANLYCARARDQGQKEAVLPEAAREKVFYPVSATTGQ
ncbi:MAG: glycosyltransferase [Bacteroidota bacterium]